MEVQHTNGGVVVLTYQDDRNIDGSASVRVVQNEDGEGVHVTLDGAGGRRELDLSYFGALALQAALGLSQVPPPPLSR